MSLYDPGPVAQRFSRAWIVPLLLGLAITLTLRGYQFGGGNHNVYLIAPLREVHPELLKNDWWSTQTLQYHLAFTKLTAALMRLRIVEPAFLVMYLALAVLLHLAWLRITLAVGLTARNYLLSGLLYYLSAGGTGLGTYQFLQDSSLLPGNIANVAMLWGLYHWIVQRRWPAASCLAIASLFHLNHALIAIGGWIAASLLAPPPVGRASTRLSSPKSAHQHLANARNSRFDTVRTRLTANFLPLLLIILAALPNIIPAARLMLAGGPKLPLAVFVDLYVRLRHPHHYDPLSWPTGLWISFLWPIPLVWIFFRNARRTAPPQAVAEGDTYAAIMRAAYAFGFFMLLQLVALVFAGIFFVSEPLIQMSLFRFSVYPKLLSCIGAAGFLLQPRLIQGRLIQRLTVLLPLALLAAVLAGRRFAGGSTAAFITLNLVPLLTLVGLLGLIVAFLTLSTLSGRLSTFGAALVLVATLLGAWSHWLGLSLPTKDSTDRLYLEICRYARQQTPVDAVFLVPPNEQLFRYHARRAIIVNFKCVPQLSSELPQWRDRLQAVIGCPLNRIPRRFDLAHEALAQRYLQRHPEELATTARACGARFIVTTTTMPGHNAVFENDRFHLYDLTQP